MPPSAEVPPPTRGEKLAWCFFDFANSSFVTVIVTVVFPLWFRGVIVGDDGHAGLKNDTWWGLAIVASQLVVVVSAPVLGALADRRASKKSFLMTTWLVCAGATALLSFSQPGWVLYAFALFVIANVAFSSGENLVAGFLPELAAPEEMGRLSGLGWALGYFGGLGALVMCLAFAEARPDLVPLAVAAFFLLAGLPTFILLRERARPRVDDGAPGVFREAFGELRRTLSERHRFQDFFRFLAAILLFQGGVAIVIAFASPYARDEIGMEPDEIIVFFIGLQLAAAVGAWTFGWLQDRAGSRQSLVLSLFTWIIAVLIAASARSQGTFAIAGVLCGLGIGSTQAASRAVVGLLCPSEREAEWFGLWGLATKGAAVLGLALFTITVQQLDLRSAVLGSTLLFVAGLLVLLSVDVERGRSQARGQSSPRPEA